MLVEETGVGMLVVAPVRERGLKLSWSALIVRYCCRSRKGAWIEMHVAESV